MPVDHPKAVQRCTIFSTVQYGAAISQRSGNVVVIPMVYLVTMDAAIHPSFSSPSEDTIRGFVLFP